jgi:serine/threonine-protein kinase
MQRDGDSTAGDEFRPFGRYLLAETLGAGGMGTVYVARWLGEVGFARTLVVKRLHPEYVQDPEHVAMLIDEARFASRILHPNVVQTIDIVRGRGELALVFEYVHGESLHGLAVKAVAREETVPARIMSALLIDALEGLHAAHEAKDERGRPLELVHRDATMHNVLVGIDGRGRLSDFGIATGTDRVSGRTLHGALKGRLAYLSPEQVRGDRLSRRSDLFTIGVVAWELSTGKRLFAAETPELTLASILERPAPSPSEVTRLHCPDGLPDIERARLDAVILRALRQRPDDRFATAREMAEALREAVSPASTTEVSAWMQREARDELEKRAAMVARAELATAPAVPEADRIESLLLRGDADVAKAQALQKAASEPVQTSTVPMLTLRRNRPSPRPSKALAVVALAVAAGLAALIAIVLAR